VALRAVGRESPEPLKSRDAKPEAAVMFEEAREFAGDREALWRRASKVEDVPRYWHGTKELTAVSKEGSVTKAKVRFAFGGSGTAEYEVRETERKLVIRYVSGPFVGTQEVWIDMAGIATKWDVRFRGIFRIASGWNEDHFREGSKHALERLCEGLDARSPGPGDRAAPREG